jgi:hypothetical protein
MPETPRPRSRRFAWFPVPAGSDLPPAPRIVRTRIGTDPAGLLGLVTPPREGRRRTESQWELVRVLQDRIDDLLERIDELRETVSELRAERAELRAERSELRRRLGQRAESE